MEASIVSIAADEDAKSAGVVASLPSVLRWLGSREDNWLMIFDGADMGCEVVEGFLPPGKHGNILMSSRNVTMNRLSSPLRAYVEVFELDAHTAVELFVKSAQLGDLTPEELGHVNTIVQHLCCFPLAVDQAAASIRSGDCHIDNYLKLYQRRLHSMEDRTFTCLSNYNRSVYTSLDISLGELECRASYSSPDPTPYKAAILILQLLSFFPLANGVCEEIFRRAADTKSPYLDPLQRDSQLLPFLQQTEDNEWDSFAFRAGLRILSKCPFIGTDENFTRAYGMHRLVQRWMQDRLPKFSGSEMAFLNTIAHGLSLAGGNPNAIEDVGAEAEPFGDSFDNDEDTSSGFQAIPGPGTQIESSSEEQPTIPDVSPAIATSLEAENAAESGLIQ
jgi:hypothetical protein